MRAVQTAAIASLLLVACGGSGQRSLPPSAPMPDGPGWVGHWSTNLGTVELVATTDLDVAPELREQRAADPFAGRYALDRDGARVEGALTCNAPTDNRLYCTWDLSEDVEGSAARGQQVMADPLQSPRVGSWIAPGGIAIARRDLLERGEQASHVRGRSLMHDVEVEGRDGRAAKHRRHAPDHDQLDLLTRKDLERLLEPDPRPHLS